MNPLEIRHILVRTGQLDCDIAVRLDTLYVSSALAERALLRFPNLSHHVCVNGSGERFGDEIVGTELAHLFEHIALDLMGRDSDNTSSCIIGHTCWAAELSNTRPHGFALMRTTLAFTDDFSCLLACKNAQRIVNELVYA